MNKVFVIIPAFNEEGNIGQLLDELSQLDITNEVKVIMVDDGSIDKTREIAEGFKDKLNLEIFIHPRNLGVPRTFFDGFKTAASQAEDNDIIILMEGDKTSDLKLFSEMIEKINSGSQLVIASRYIKGGCYKNFPFVRVLGSKIINLALKIFFKVNGVTDYTIFYRAYQAGIIKKALEKYQDNFITTKSFAANLEVLIKVKEYISGVSEVPLVYDYGLKKGKSKMKLFKTLWEYKDLIIRRKELIQK